MKIDQTTLSAYLLNAYWQWLTDNNDVPYIHVDCTYPGVKVPLSAIKNNAIVLNLSMAAAEHLSISGKSITFSARFGGKAHSILVPCLAVKAIYGRDSLQGQAFQHAAPTPTPAADGTTAEQSTEQSAAPPATDDKPTRKNHLSVVK